MEGGEQKYMERAPCAKPPFTVSDIKKAIPAHCFQPTVLRSLSYVILDLSLLSIFYFIASNYFPLLPSTYCYFAWPVYWAIQGCVCFGCWVIGHECGHHAFSDYQWLDDTVGFFVHTSLMIPYFSLKFSHRRHHSYSGCLDQDDVFAPMCKSQLPWYSKYLNNPLGRVANLVFTITLGWPLYLAINIRGTYNRFASHYDPYGPIFKERERFYIFVSDAGLVAFIYLLYRVSLVKGLTWVICLYGVPVSVMNGLVVLVTLLQHTHPALPRYDLTEWDWLRGALVTADRDYGILNKVFHHIGDTHVLHHIFTRVPHYHAIEATKAMKPLLGDYYKSDDTPIYSALWREAKECLYIEPDESSPNKGVYWYKSKY